jgi:hypothetical protein
MENRFPSGPFERHGHAGEVDGVDGGDDPDGRSFGAHQIRV